MFNIPWNRRECLGSTYIQFPVFYSSHSEANLCLTSPSAIQFLDCVQTVLYITATSLVLFRRVQKILSKKILIKITFSLCDVTLNYQTVILQLLFRRCPVRISVRNYFVMNDIFMDFHLIARKFPFLIIYNKNSSSFTYLITLFLIYNKRKNCRRHN